LPGLPLERQRAITRRETGIKFPQPILGDKEEIMSRKAEIERSESGSWYVYIDGLPKTSPLKARRQAIAYCKRHHLDYEIVS
jgi:hypothetical protein